MAEILLDNGMKAVIDDDDYEKISSRKWYARKGGSTYYAYTIFTKYKNGKRCKSGEAMHREILNLAHADGNVCDHINGNGLDNRKQNLRKTNASINGLNCKNYKNNTSGFRGVNWNKGIRKWTSYIRINGEKKYLGSFTDKQEASSVYNKKLNSLLEA